MKKGVIGGLIVAGLAGLAGWAALKFTSSNAAAAEVEGGGGYAEGSTVNGGGVPDLTSFIQGINSTGTTAPTAETDDIIMATMLKSMQPSDENADAVQAATLADALTDTKLASSNQIYNALLETADNYKNDDGTYTGFGFTYQDLNQFAGELARQAAIKSIGSDAYNALSTGRQSVLISSIRHGKADTVDSSGEFAGQKTGGNISGETFDSLLTATKAGTAYSTKSSGSSGGSGSVSAAQKSSYSQNAAIQAKASGTAKTYSNSDGSTFSGTGTRNKHAH